MNRNSILSLLLEVVDEYGIGTKSTLMHKNLMQIELQELDPGLGI